MPNRIDINRLLMEREDRLVEIFDLERQINAVLGEPYPLIPPDSLPSRQKRRKPRRKAVEKAKAVVRLRKLDPEKETAYRIVYQENDVIKTEIHTQSKPLALLANSKLPGLSVERIETIRDAGDGNWETVETLMSET